jgi:hypothetical protein
LRRLTWAVRRLTEGPRGIVALIAYIELICVGVLIGHLSLPLSGRQVSLVLETQTGLRESDRLSTLARSRACKGETDEDDGKPAKGAGHPTAGEHVRPPGLV